MYHLGWRPGYSGVLLICISAAALLQGGGTAEHDCKFKTLAVGHTVASATELSRRIKKHGQVLIGFSSSACRSCCHAEAIYNESLALLPPKVEWLRVDVAEPALKNVAASYKVETIPSIVFVHDRKRVTLQEVPSSASVLGMVERVLKPLPVLRAGNDVDSWLDVSSHFSAEGEEAQNTLRLFLRVTAVLGDGADAEEELEDLRLLAQEHAGRPQAVRFAHITSPATAAQLAKSPVMKRTACPAAISSRGTTMVVVAVLDGEYVEVSRMENSEHDEPAVLHMPLLPGETLASQSVLNVSRLSTPQHGAAQAVHIMPRVACRSLDSYDSLSLAKWLLLSTLPPVGRFDHETSGLYEKTELPLVMLFADLERDDLHKWLKLLSEARKRYQEEKIVFVYADGMAHGHHMASLGLVADRLRLPALSINFVDDRHLFWQPSAEAYSNGTAVMNKMVIDSLVQKYLYGDGAKLAEGDAPGSMPVPTRNLAAGERREVPSLDTLSLEERLRYVTAVTQDSFHGVVFDSAKDVAVYFYPSSGRGSKKAMDAAIYVNRCAERFQELNIKTVVIARLDVSRFSVPAVVHLDKVPTILLFPAFAKDPPYLMFTGKMSTQRLMWWIEDHASRKFKLPDLPHLDRLEAKEYWVQKAQMSAKDQEMVAKANERRDGKNEL